MPYIYKKKKGKWHKINTETGKLKSTHNTLELAKASVKAYHARKRKSSIQKKAQLQKNLSWFDSVKEKDYSPVKIIKGDKELIRKFKKYKIPYVIG